MRLLYGALQFSAPCAQATCSVGSRQNYCAHCTDDETELLKTFPVLCRRMRLQEDAGLWTSELFAFLLPFDFSTIDFD